MKKILSILALVMLTLGISAESKTWNFADLSAADKALLDGDLTNWTYDATNLRYANTADYLPSGEALKAGGQELAVTKGLLIGGVTKADRIRLSVKTSYQVLVLNSSGLTVTIPNLKKGQKIAVTSKTGASGKANGFTLTNITADDGSFVESADDKKENTGVVTADGDVVLTTSGESGAMVIYSITVSDADDNSGGNSGNDDTSDRPDSWTFSVNDYANDLTSLAATGTNWTDATATSRYENAYFPNNEVLKGNDGNVLEITKGLRFTAAKAGRIRISYSSTNKVLILSEAGLTITIPGLKKGQEISVVAKTANSGKPSGLSATNLKNTTNFGETTASTDKTTYTGTVVAGGDVVLTTIIPEGGESAGVAFTSITITGEGEEDVAHDIKVNTTTNGTVTPSKTSAKPGETITLTITSANGYVLEALSIDYEKTTSTNNSNGGGLSGARSKAPGVGDFGNWEYTLSSDNTSATFTMPDGPVTITATFKAEEAPSTRTLTVSKEWVTFCSPITFKVPEGLNAYIVTAVTQPADGETGEITTKKQDYVVANTPMLIENTTVSTQTAFEVTEATASVSGTPCNEYKGVTAATTIPADTYVLVDGTFLRTDGGTLPAYHCYFQFSTGSGARSFIINVDNTTGISTATLGTTAGDNQWYTLNGMRISQPTQKGVYILNGKKYIVK